MIDQITGLESRVSATLLSQAKLQGELKALTSRYSEVESAVALAKGRLAHVEAVDAFLNELQTRMHEKSLGKLEKLLTALVKDILPEADRKIVMELGIDKKISALDLYVSENDNKEDILEGNGGALTNIISAGLRYAALSRTANRKFIVLDEPDCWLRPTRVPAFMNVLSQMANEIGVQTLLISHHDPSLFNETISKVELTLVADKIIATPEYGEVHKWMASEKGIRSIRLINFRRHVDTTIPLSKGITALIGDNNLGKSAIVSALRAVAYGESDDTMIRHGQDFCEVYLEIDAGNVIKFRRVKKGSPKTTWELSDKDGNLIHDGSASRGSAPDWLLKELGIAKCDDLDIQIGSQKSPVFLLDEPASKRASILSVGRESGYLKEMMEEWRAWIKQDRETVKKGESELAYIKIKQDKLKKLDTLPNLKDLKQNLNVLSKTENVSKELNKLSDSIESLENKVAILKPDLKRLTEIKIAVPEIHPIEALLQMGQKIQRLSSTLEKVKPILDYVSPVAPSLSDTLKLDSLIKNIEKHTNLKSKSLNIEGSQVDCPEIKDISSLEAVAKKLKGMQELLSEITKKLNSAEQDEKDCALEIDKTWKQLGNICPLCGSEHEENTHAI